MTDGMNGAAEILTSGRRRGRPAVVATVLACLLAAGCAAGPNFKTPDAPKVDRYLAQPLSPAAATPNVVGGEAQRFETDAEIPGDWWTLFHSPALNALIERSLAANHDLKAAQAAL